MAAIGADGGPLASPAYDVRGPVSGRGTGGGGRTGGGTSEIGGNTTTTTTIDLASDSTATTQPDILIFGGPSGSRGEM